LPETTIAPGGGAAAIISAFIISLAPPGLLVFSYPQGHCPMEYYEPAKGFSRAGSLLLTRKCTILTSFERSAMNRSPSARISIEGLEHNRKVS
jgi:hypothetical protein